MGQVKHESLREAHGITLEKSLPANTEAEQMILGVVILENKTLAQAVDGGLTPDDFFLPSHGKIYAAMLRLAAEEGGGIDPTTLSEELRRVGELDRVGGPAFIASLFDGVPRFSNIEKYVRIVKEKFILRQLIGAAHQVEMRAFDDEEAVSEQLQKAQALFLDIRDGRQKRQWHHVGNIAAERLAAIEQRTGKPMLGIPTGFYDLDSMLLGLEPKTLIIVGARPSMGKSALMMDICEYAALNEEDYGNPVAVFSIEMSKEQIVDRMLASRAEINGQLIRSGNIGKDDWRRAMFTTGELANCPVLIDDSGEMTLQAMRQQLIQLRAEHGNPKLIAVDYLQLMTGDRGSRDSRNDEVWKFSRGLKQIAKEFDCPVLALAQLSRDLERRPNKRPVMSDLRDSGGLEQDGDVVMFIYRDEVYHPETEKQNIAEIIVAKQRNGPIGTVELVFNKQRTRFYNLMRQVG